MSKEILTSIHGRKFGIAADGCLIVHAGPNGKRVVVSSFGGGAMIRPQSAPGTLNATGALTTDLIKTGIVTSTTASAVTATLPTGAALEAAFKLDLDDAIEWKVINTGSNNFTVQVADGHTVVGGLVVAGGASGRFLTRRSAANTFVTYRV
jgi:hypothetical protein